MKKRGVVLCLAAVLVSLSFSAPGFRPEDRAKSAIDRNDMDTSVRPGNDFFRFACGGWIDRLAMPDDRVAYRTKELIEEARDRELETLLERIVAAKDAPFGSDVQQIRDFFLTAIDESKSEAEGVSALEEDFRLIDRLSDRASLQDLLASFQTFNLTPLFSLAVRTDPKNTEAYILNINSGGLGLPGRDDYLDAGEKAASTRSAYLAHIGRMLGLTGIESGEAAGQARLALAVEARLAEKMLSPLEQRDMAAQYHKLTLPELEALCPAIAWDRYFARVGVAPQSVIVDNPAFLAEISRMIKDIPVSTWKAFLRWKLLDDMAAFLGAPFDRANFDFYGAFLRGQKAPRSRRSQALDFVNEGLGEILGRIYVRDYFSAEAKGRVEEIFGFLKRALKSRIEALDWMSPATKSEALAKLEAMRLMAGYPDKAKDYSGLEIRSDSFVLNIKRLLAFLVKDNMALCGQAVDRDAWSGMYAHTANAGYMPIRNRIVFPAAMLRPPLFFPEGDAAVNFGALGFALAHEMMHAFDDQGRRFDKDGNIRDWWTPEDEAEFKRRAVVLVDQYAAFRAPDGTSVDGRLTLGENIADAGGLRVAWDAYRIYLNGAAPAAIDGFTHEERFFLSFAGFFRGKIRPEALARMMKQDRHPWGAFRVNGAPFHLADFYRIFDVRPGDALYLDESRRLKIW